LFGAADGDYDVCVIYEVVGVVDTTYGYDSGLGREKGKERKHFAKWDVKKCDMKVGQMGEGEWDLEMEDLE
jgi:hypothetical protein